MLLGKKKEIGSILAARWRGKQANTDARMDVAVRQPSHIKWAAKKLKRKIILCFCYILKLNQPEKNSADMYKTRSCSHINS